MLEAKQRARFSLFVSGNGRGAVEVLKRYAAGEVTPELGLVLSTISDSQALRVAQDQGIATVVIKRNAFPSKEAFEQTILDALVEHAIEFVFLSGYRYKVDATLLAPFRGRMLNVHPSLLPSFKGLHALQQALEYGVKVAGISVHYVEEEIDEGRILMQAAADVLEGETFETLDAKVFPLGVRLMVEAINRTFVKSQ